MHAVLREVQEETGLIVEVLRLTSLYYHADRDSITFAFLCRPVSGELRAQPGEIAECGFFSLDALPRPIRVHTVQRIHDGLRKAQKANLRVLERREWLP
jgi:8-oxo-dGTP diphosphatase